jgi:hypothetical protein
VAEQVLDVVAGDVEEQHVPQQVARSPCRNIDVNSVFQFACHWSGTIA